MLVTSLSLRSRFGLSPWSAWVADHPDTTVLRDATYTNRFRSARGHDNFVIGVALEDSATAYQYRLASERRVINDRVGEHPVVVLVDPDTRNIRIYLRRLGASESGPSELRFEMDDRGQLVDVDTYSVWDTSRGIATEGPLNGTALQQIPYVTSFDWAWREFFPHTTFYGED